MTQPSYTPENHLRMEPTYIVALEIGSSKVRGGVGVLQPDGALAIKAVEEEKLIN